MLPLDCMYIFQHKMRYKSEVLYCEKPTITYSRWNLNKMIELADTIRCTLYNALSNILHLFKSKLVCRLLTT